MIRVKIRFCIIKLISKQSLYTYYWMKDFHNNTYKNVHFYQLCNEYQKIEKQILNIIRYFIKYHLTDIIERYCPREYDKIISEELILLKTILVDQMRKLFPNVTQCKKCVIHFILWRVGKKYHYGQIDV